MKDTSVMKNKNHKNKEDAKTSGTSKEKATFDQNGKGASDKFGEAGETPNESGGDGTETAKKDGRK